MNNPPETPDLSPNRHVSADGLFEFRSDLGVWQPLSQVPQGTNTPDGRFQWTGTNWHPVYRLPPITSRGRTRTASSVLVSVLGVLGACGLLVVVAFVAIGAYFTVHPPCFSSKGC